MKETYEAADVQLIFSQHIPHAVLCAFNYLSAAARGGRARILPEEWANLATDCHRPLRLRPQQISGSASRRLRETKVLKQVPRGPPRISIATASLITDGLFVDDPFRLSSPRILSSHNGSPPHPSTTPCSALTK